MLTYEAERLLYSTWFSGASLMASENAVIASSKFPAEKALLPCACRSEQNQSASAGGNQKDALPGDCLTLRSSALIWSLQMPDD